ncbi:MAG: hydantoinase/oxoprolinase family protein, partial [Actinomycetota bacterium]|nr:hydantoinase/oxoprolinase family protein [Actinomycetota bacterium]
LEVGPQSAGSYPGPVCYNMGGTEPTTTDADLVLGYINPDNYFGGKMKLNKDAAERAIRAKIAEPLGVSTVEAAALIRRIVDEKMASAIRKEVVLRGYRPSDFLLFAFGGGGPTHVAGYMGEIPRAAIFQFSPVFSAYGSSVMDVMHLYERSQRMTFIEPVTQQATTDYESFNNVVREMMEVAKQELEAEGLPLEKAVFSLELDMLYGGQIHSKRASAPDLFVNSEEDVWRFYKQFEQEFSEAFSPLAVNVPGGVYIDTFVLRVAVPGQELQLEKYELQGEDPSAARKGNREAYWPESQDGMVETDVYDLDALKPGNVVTGPALLESEYTTVVVPPTRRLRTNEYAISILEAKE